MADQNRRAGWYPDPDGASGERWWNGAGWSDSRRGGAAPAARAVPVAPAAPVVPVTPTIPVVSSTAVPPPYTPAAPAPPARPDPYAPTVNTTVWQSSPSRSINVSVNRNAMIGFVTGLIALFFNFLFVLGPVAVVFSGLGIAKARQLRAQGVTANLMVFAAVGLGAGLVATLIGIVSAIAIIVPFVTMTNS